MISEFNPKNIESKWQKYWQENNIYTTAYDTNKPKFYCLVEFPYPSGAGLHVGHVKGQTAVDIYARFKRMNGYNVLCPMGWDAFGLPAENFAIKNKKHPAEFTQTNIDNFRRQIQSFGPSFDWDREIDTTDPQYYKWTQWIFLQLFKKGLAYEKEAPINWCPSCLCGLANEEVIDNKCERCDTQVEQKMMKQWFLKITEYADRLADDLDEVNWPEYIKTSQRNWIGRSDGAEVDFKVKNYDDILKVFTTRINTIYGVTFMVLAPEHPLVDKITTPEYIKEIKQYQEQSKKKNEIERTDATKEKTGVFTGSYAINPASGEEIPIYISDYVMMGYGTGAIMAVPAHDERDWEFAKKYNIEVKYVNGLKKLPPNTTPLNIGENNSWLKIKNQLLFIPNNKPLIEKGILINSDTFNGLIVEKAQAKMIETWNKEGWVKTKTTYKLRDWLFSRQRYWGEPIPIIHCPKCGQVPLPEDQLPLLLPEVENYEPSGNGESPLASIEEWVNVDCPTCGEKSKRETNTMPQWAGSSWYFLRYIDPKNNEQLATAELLKHFMPVDIYFGGAEHTTVHLLYSRFWNKALYDLGICPTNEPYSRRVQHGLILAEDGRKMSKRWGNVINPDDVINQYGADTMRTYIMFMGPYGDTSAWSTTAIEGIARFLRKVYNLINKKITNTPSDPETLKILHQSIKKITNDIERVSYHTAISNLMILNNHLQTLDKIEKIVLETYLKLLAPFAPYLSEELWHILNNNTSIHLEKWPQFDESLTIESEITIVIQINGKLRGEVQVSPNISQEEAFIKAKSNPDILKYIENKNIVKEIYVPNKIINIVIKD